MQVGRMVLRSQTLTKMLSNVQGVRIKNDDQNVPHATRMVAPWATVTVRTFVAHCSLRQCCSSRNHDTPFIMIMIMNQLTCHPKPQVPPARVGSGEEPAAGGPAAAAHAAAPPTAAAPAAPPPAVPPVPAPPGPDDYPARPQVCPTTHTALFPSLLLLLLWRSSLSPSLSPLSSRPPL